MERENDFADSQKRKILCDSFRDLSEKGDYLECEQLIISAMGKYPHSPVPHNLMGVLLEYQNDHLAAMKHFRAAWALDPTYMPARMNLEHYSSFVPLGPYVIDEGDCMVEESREAYKIEYDEHGIGHVLKRRVQLC
ncbi:MAG TPA: hypothetical protein VFF80_02925 [Bacillota bacterium]|nr:hypothetical protein [Bacillota bacterium]